MRNYLTEKNTKKLEGWIRLCKGFNTSLYIEKAGYFDERPQLHISVTQILSLLIFPFLLSYSLLFLVLTPLIFFGYGKLYINLPIKTGIEDCDSAAWGFNYHNNTIWIYIGGGGNHEGGKKWKTFIMPWQLKWYRTSLLLNDDTWEHEYKGSRKDFYKEIWNKKKWSCRADYLDKYDNKTIKSTLCIEEREWRRTGMMWSSLFGTTSRTLSVNFDEEVGPQKGSWKGGTISFEISNDEEIPVALERLGFKSLEMIRDKKIDDILNEKVS